MALYQARRFDMPSRAPTPPVIATSLDVFIYSGDVYSIDLTQSPPIVSTIATGTTFFYITAPVPTAAPMDRFQVRSLGSAAPCASSPSTTTGPELSLSGPGVTGPDLLFVSHLHGTAR